MLGFSKLQHTSASHGLQAPWGAVKGWRMARVTTATGRVGLAIAAGLLLATASVPRAQVSTPPATSGAPTFTKDVLPIVQRSCQKCHRPDTSAPMSLLTYQEVRPWARSIKQKVTRREMPPW